MSMEAQFYEARRRQSFIDRRHSLRSERETKPKPERHSSQIPVPVFRSKSQSQPSWLVIPPAHRAKMTFCNNSLFQRDRDIYP